MRSWERMTLRLWRNRYALSTLVLLQVMDVLSTALAVRAGAPEDNPFVDAVLGAHGAPGMAAAKFGVVALAFAAVAVDPGKGPYVPAALWIMNGVMALVVGLNFLSFGLLSGIWELALAYIVLMALATVVVWEHVRGHDGHAPDSTTQEELRTA